LIGATGATLTNSFSNTTISNTTTGYVYVYLTTPSVITTKTIHLAAHSSGPVLININNGEKYILNGLNQTAQFLYIPAINEWINTNNLYTNIVSVQLQDKLLGNGTVGNTGQFGSSVAISGDSNTIAVGAYTDNAGVGTIWIFGRTGGIGTFSGIQGLTGITGSNGQSNIGQSVSLSDNGNTLVVGGPGDNGNTGAAWVFGRTGSTGTFIQLQELTESGEIGPVYFGVSVAVSHDSNTIAIGGPGDHNNLGATWIFGRTGSTGSYQLLQNKLVGSGFTGTPPYIGQGTSVALSGDSNTLAVGGPGNNNGVGAVWIFGRTGSTGPFGTTGTKIVPSGYYGTSYFGSSVSLSENGSILAVGAPNDNISTGAGYIFTLGGTGWTQQAKLTPNNVSISNRLGLSVSLSSDGTVVAMGAPVAIIPGTTNISQLVSSTCIFTFSSGIWQQAQTLMGTNSIPPSGQGWSVSLSDDGQTLVVGGETDNGNMGAAWVFIG
jgi:hypothetical protein